MTSRVIIDLYSGIPNPSWWLADEDVAAMFVRRVQALPLARLERAAAVPRFGYKGVTIVPGANLAPRAFTAVGGLVFERGADIVRLDEGRRIERDLFNSAPPVVLAAHGLTYELVTAPPPGTFRISGLSGTGVLGGLACANAPAYIGHTGVWAADVGGLPNPNNCYAYANDHPIALGQYGVPGPKATSVPSDVAKMRQRLAQDRLDITVPATTLPSACPTAPPGKRAHYLVVCLRKTPGSLTDFHCLRLDSNGRWSHKDGSGPVVDEDVTGAQIVDLRTAEFDAKMTLVGFYASVECRRKID